MTTTSADLLRGLASGVRPYETGSDGPRVGGTEAPGAPDFASLLQRARSGAISTGKPVTIAPGAQVQLSEQQMARLAQAADVAEASGATRALVVMDGKAFKLDVAVRTVTGVSEFTEGTVCTGFDAVVRVPETGGAAAVKAAAGPLGMNNASLLKALAKDPAAEM